MRRVDGMRGFSGRKGMGSGGAGPVGCREEQDFILWAMGSHGGFRARE